jgi:hypothetical protein
MSKAHLPPVPPAGRSPKGPGSQTGTPGQEQGDISARQADAGARDRNLGEQGRQGNIKQNTTHQGHQQDR